MKGDLREIEQRVPALHLHTVALTAAEKPTVWADATGITLNVGYRGDGVFCRGVPDPYH